MSGRKLESQLISEDIYSYIASIEREEDTNEQNRNGSTNDNHDSISASKASYLALVKTRSEEETKEQLKFIARDIDVHTKLREENSVIFLIVLKRFVQ